MDSLNSQRLTYLDGYLHAFRESGAYEYRVLYLQRGYEASEPSKAFTIEVRQDGSKMGGGKQYDVTLNWDVSSRAYLPDPARIELGINDYVIWHVATSTAAIPPYSIRGDSAGKPVFDSRALGQHDVFTHFFMTPGKYTYRISGQATGSISVLDHQQMERTDYQKRTTQAPVIHIVQGKPQPDQLEIVTGQTVVWFVEQGGEVTIVADQAVGR